MEDDKKLYVLGQPISTPLGEMHFIKVFEYPSLLKLVPYLELQKFEVIDIVRNKNKDLADYFKDKSFIRVIKGLKETYEIYDMFSELFQLCFKEPVFDYIEDDEEFEKYRDMIRKMNCITHEEKNPNPEIQYFNDLKKLKQQKNGNSITFESIYTSVLLETGMDVNNLTVYQLYAIFNRITQFKNHESTILYSTVSGDVKIEDWYKHVDILNEEEKQLTSLEEIQSQGFNNLGNVKKI